MISIRPLRPADCIGLCRFRQAGWTWVALDANATPARMSFKMVWKSTGEPVVYVDAARQFRFEGTRAVCQMEAQVEVPSLGFSWKSDPLASSSAAFAIVGNEANGRYYG
jgi:hypothetical protein